MATTTNYGWTTPDDTALVKDGAAAIRTLGTSIDTTTKNLNPSTTLGDIEYRSSSANVNTRLGIGSTGNILTVAGGVPTWAAPAGGGKVLQVVNATHSTAFTTTSNSLADTGLTATITPSAATSKILVLITYAADSTVVSNYAGWNVAILRGATSIWTSTGYDGGAGFIFGQNWTNTNIYRSTNTLTYLDSPSTTSATTYKLQGAKQSSTPSATFNPSSSTSSITLLEIGA
jgi:hypothetical protein